MSSISPDPRTEEYLTAFENMPQERRVLHFAIALRWLTALIERNELMDNVAASTPKQLGMM